MDRVTQDRNAYHDPMVEDEKATRFAQWKSGLVVSSHVLAKRVGDTIVARWDVTNTGGVNATGFLEMTFPLFPSFPGTVFRGINETIPPGFTVGLIMTVDVPNLPPGDNPVQLRVRAVAPATVAPGALHNFTVIIPAALGGILTASGAGPSIT